MYNILLILIKHSVLHKLCDQIYQASSHKSPSSFLDFNTYSYIYSDIKVCIDVINQNKEPTNI